MENEIRAPRAGTIGQWGLRGRTSRSATCSWSSASGGSGVGRRAGGRIGPRRGGGARDRRRRPPRALAGDHPGQGGRVVDRAPPDFLTTSDIPIADLYTPADIAGLDEDRDLGRPGSSRSPAASSRRCTAAASGRCASTPASRPPPRPTSASGTCSAQGQTGLSVAFDLPTQMGYDSRRARGAGRGRPGRRADRLARGHGESCSTACRWARSRTSMTINATAADPAGLLRRGRPSEQGVARAKLGGTVQNDILKEYIARGTYIYPAAAVDAPGDRHLRVLRHGAAALEHDQHQRLPHARGRRDRGAGAGLHARRRHRLRRCGARARPGRRRLRGPAVVLLRRLERAVRGGGQVPGRPPDVGAHHARPLRRDERALDDVPLPHPDRRPQPDRAVDRQQRRPDDGPGAGRGPRRHPEPAHQLAGRGARAADRRSRPGWPCARSRSWPTRAA